MLIAFITVFLILNSVKITGTADYNDVLNDTTTTSPNPPPEEETGPLEIQSAQCTITAGDVKASAQASISKKLEGVCGSKDMAVSFQLLESKLMQEINNLKIMIAQLKDPHFNPHQYFHPPNPIYYPIPHQNIRPIPQYPKQPTSPLPQQTTPKENIFISTTTTTALPIASTTENNKEMIIDFKPIIFATTPSPPVKTTTTQPELKPIPPKTKSLQSKHKTRSGPRDFEVHRFNNTIMSGGEVQIFTYFWKIDNFTTKLKNNLTEIISPIFTISGLHLRVKAILNYLNRDLLYLQIESVSQDVISNSSNIILETGNLFQEIETKKLFRHKIIILDQASAEQTDLISQEFLNTNSGFMIPNSAISSSSYSKDDSILIKIIIYL